jgi:2-(1,2-epoxy-1,2-dihydrophenyl)acetyl-CoA isomerase
MTKWRSLAWPRLSAWLLVLPEVMGLAKTLMARSFRDLVARYVCLRQGFGRVLAMSNPEFREGFAAAMEGRKADFVMAAANAPDKAR